MGLERKALGEDGMPAVAIFSQLFFPCDSLEPVTNVRQRFAAPKLIGPGAREYRQTADGCGMGSPG